MLESKKTIIAFAFITIIFFLSGSLGLTSGMDEEISIPQENGLETNLELKTQDLEGIETGTDPIHSDISSTQKSVSAYQESNDEINKNMLSITYSFSAPIMEKIGKYHIPKMSETRNDNEPGMPMLPAKVAKILLPQGEILSDINLVIKNEVTLDGIYLIKPGEIPAIFGSENPSPEAEMLNSSVYDSEEPYPRLLYSDVSVQTFRGYQILILKLYPMQYIPSEGKVLYFERIELVVTTHHTGGQSPLYRGLIEDRNLVETMVDNPAVLATYKPKIEKKPTGGIVPLSITDASESYDYVIITNDALASSFQPLANNKNSSGINTTVIRIEDIYADPDYGFNGSNHQVAIRNFIKDAYINWSISYVLLGGDDEIIPHRGCYGYVFSITGPKEDDDIPTDLYYGGLDGNWDNDGDGIYGEKNVTKGGGGDAGEESDLYAEVFVGRAPVNTVAEAQTFVDKVIFFEANPRPKHVTLHGEEDLYGNQIDKVKNNTGGYAAPGVEIFIPSIYNITRLYEVEGHAINKAIWEAEIANNTLFVNHGGHGQVNSYEIRGSGFISYTKSDAAIITNSYYPIHLSIACYSGSFDGRKDDNTYVGDYDCIAEKYITNPSGGMVACILNSRYGWFTFGDVTAYSGELDNEFYNQLFNNNEMRIGKTLQKAKEVYANDALTHNTYRWVVYEWNLLGDPTMLIFGIDNVTPIADAGPDNATGTDQPIMLDGSGSTDDSGYIAWYNWTFGDGASFNSSGTKNSKVVHIYSDPGVYTVVLNVSDAWGNWDNDTCNITVWDATPPNTTLTINDPKYRANVDDDWNITHTTSFNLTAEDEYSGVNFTWYTIDGVYFEYDGTNFTLAGYSEGPHNISWGSEDNSGNNGTINATVWIDESAPSTQLSIAEPRHPNTPDNGCNVTPSTIFSLTGTDNPSHNTGISFSWFLIDSDYYEGTMFDFSSYGEGQHTINWGSEDNLGFNESANTIVVWVDDTAPQTSLTINQPKYPFTPDNGCNVTSTTIFNLIPQDYPAHNAGVAISWYSIESDYYEGTSFNLLGYPEGQINITWGSIDQLGSNETGNLLVVWLDDSEPFTALIIGFPKYPISPKNGTNVTSSTPFTLLAQDQPSHSSGISFNWYMIDANYHVGMQFNLSGYGEGIHIITWGSEDYLGHNETNSITVWLDDSAPITNLTIGSEKYPSGGYDGCNVTRNTTFTLSPIDFPAHNSSIKSIWYIIDGKYHEKFNMSTNFSLSEFALKFEGPYNITWGSIDNLGNNETANLITVFFDKDPPYTILKIGEPNWYKNNNYYVTDNTTIILNSTDQFSGVSFGWYIIEGQYFEGSTFNLSGYDDGAYTIVYGSQDNLGHNETAKNRTFVLDTTLPTSTLEIGYPKSRADDGDFWNVTTSTMFTILSNDASSGVEIEWYVIDGDYFEGPVFTLDGYPDGMHTIIWGARDMLGNNKTSNTTIVFIDTHSPVTNLTLTGIGYRLNDGDNWNVTSQTNFNLTATELYSDVKFTWYKIDSRYFEGESFNLSGYSDGMHSITWGSVDRLGNNETGNTELVIIDNSPPLTDINVGTPKYRGSGDDYWNVTEESLFTLVYSDSYSGVDTVWYTIDGEYFEDVEFNLTGYNQGMYTITWGSIDNLKNNETYNSMVVYLDITPPTTFLLPGDPKYRFDDTHIWNVTQSTLLSLISTDEYSGISFIWYTIDGEYFEGSEFMLIGYDDGLHNITWGAQDNLGNDETIGSMTVNVDITSPLTTIFIGGEIPPPGDDRFSMNSSTPVNLSAHDGTGVGLDYIWYSLDGGITYNLYESPFTVPVGTGAINYGARDLLGNNASSQKTKVLVDDREPVVDDGDDEPDGDGEEDVTPAYEEVLRKFLDFIVYIIILIVVVILLLLVLRWRKGKKDEVDFQTEAEQDTAPFQVTDDKVEVMVEVKEEMGPPSPPPPSSPGPPPTSPPPPPPPPPTE